MTTADVLLDAYGRIRESVRPVLDGLSEEQLAARVDPEANSVAWLVWHLARVQDDHLAEAFADRTGSQQVWTAQGWVERFGLPFAPEETGYGFSDEQVGWCARARGCWPGTRGRCSGAPRSCWPGSRTTSWSASSTSPTTRPSPWGCA